MDRRCRTVSNFSFLAILLYIVGSNLWQAETAAYSSTAAFLVEELVVKSVQNDTVTSIDKDVGVAFNNDIATKKTSDLEEYIQQSLHVVGRGNVSSSELLKDYDGRLQPMWKCSSSTNNSSRSLLIFVHVFKTAGTSFRRFFDSYGASCRKGVVSVNRCSDVSVASLATSPGTVWQSTSGIPCWKEHIRYRNGSQQVINTTDKSKLTGAFVEKHVDILAGHLPLGLHEYYNNGWRHNPNKRTQKNQTTVVQYITFFREPIAKYVSGRLYVNRHLQWSFAEAVNAIRQKVETDMRKNKYYNGYSKYLLTPQQKQLDLSMDQEVQLIESNLIEFNVMVGIVERVGDSLSLLQSIIDGDVELSTYLRKLDTTTTATTTKAATTMSHGNITDSKAVIWNQSSLSTSAIIAALQEDKDFFVKMQKHLRYEFRLYDLALKLHARQVAHLQEQYGSSYSNFG